MSVSGRQEGQLEEEVSEMEEVILQCCQLTHSRLTDGRMKNVAFVLDPDK
jgi:hypothetical protein